MKKLIIYMLIACCSINFAFAQGKVVNGTVNGDGNPLDRASIIEKGIPSNGTSTDASGKFKLTLKGKSNIIVVSYTNFLSKEINVASNETVSIRLDVDPKSAASEDVIVVAYGKQKKITNTGAVGSVSGDQIRENPAASLQNEMVGTLPGFSAQQRSGKPGSDGAAFYIRGNSSLNVATNLVNSSTPSITSGNTPLIVVDDIEYSADQFAYLDANEIESISILKDASTTAVYGIKGANGVVVVTTRRGKKGIPKVSLRTEYSLSEATVLPKYLDAANVAILYDSALSYDNTINPSTTFKLPFVQSDIDLFRNGQDPYGHPNVDWKSLLFKKFSHQSRTNVDISGGTDKVRYFASLGYIDQDGILNNFSQGQPFNSNYYNRRYNYRTNVDITVTKTLDVKVDLAGNNNSVNTPNVYLGGTTNAGNNDPFYEFTNFSSTAPFAYPIKNPDGSWGYSTWQLSPPAGSAYNGNNLIARLSLDGYNRTYNDNMVFSANAVQKLDVITKGLSAKAVLAYTSNYTYDKGLTRSNIPSFIYNPTTSTYTPRDANVYTLDKLSTSYNPRQTFRELTLQGFINYDRTFGLHHVYGLALINQDSKVATVLSSTNVINPTYNFIPVNYAGTSYRVGYDFKSKYLFQFNVGRNGTDRFSPANGKQYGIFPAVSGGWNIAEERFFQKIVPTINLFKVRASYGLVGSDNLPPGSLYSYRNDYLQNGNTSRIVTGNFGISSTPVTTSIQEGTIANPDVTWEKEKKVDIGVDFAILKRKVSGTFDYFNDNRYDMLITRGTVSQVFGQNLPPLNLGKVHNEGYEIELNYTDRIGKDFGFTLKANYAVANNKRVFIDEPTYQYAYQQSTGQPIGNPLVYKWTGQFYKDAADIAKSPQVSPSLGIARPGSLKYADINGDGIIDNNDKGFFSKPNLANINYGFSLDMHYKGFSISTLFQGIKNAAVYATSQAFFNNLTDLHLHAWTPALGNAALYPQLTLSNNGLNDPTNAPSTFWLRNADYLRMRTAQISYQLPKSLMRRLKMSDIRIYANGNNLFTWSDLFKFYSYDPEANSGNGTLPYPTQKTFNFGLSATF